MATPRPATPTMIAGAIPRAGRGTERVSGCVAIGWAMWQYLGRPSEWTAVRRPVMFQIGPDARPGKRHRRRVDHVLLRNPRFPEPNPKVLPDLAPNARSRPGRQIGRAHV